MKSPARERGGLLRPERRSGPLANLRQVGHVLDRGGDAALSGQRRLDTRTVTAGALLAAIALLLGLAAYYLPVAGEVMALIAPLPLTVAYMRYGFRTGVLAGFVASLLAGMVGGPLAAMFIAAGCALGLALGYGIIRQWSGWKTIALATAVSFVTTAATLALAVQVLGISVALAGVAAMATGFEQMAEIMRAQPLLAQSADMYVQFAGLIRTYPIETLLVAAATGGGIWSVLWYGVSAPILRRLGLAVPPAPRVAPVAVWHLPGYLGVTLLIGLAAMMFVGGRLEQGSPAHLVALQVLSWVVLAFAIQGLGLWAHFVTLAGPPPALRRAAIALGGASLFTIPFAGQVLMLAGMFDLALDVRGLYGSRRPERRAPAETDDSGFSSDDQQTRPGREEEIASGGESVDTTRPRKRGPESEFRRGKRQ